MNKRFSAIALVLALVVSIIVPFQAATPVSTVQWYGASDMAAADRDMVWYDNTTRTNASGNKITSNAHSADFGKMYFKWADKQSDDCYLKVEASVFETVEYFVLTAKSTNKYYDVKIQPADGAELTEDGCYVFYLPRMVEKNKKGVDEYYVINMVFLDKVQYKDNPSVIVEKVWLNEDGDVIEGSDPAEATFTGGYELRVLKSVEIGTRVVIEENEIEGYELVGITIDGDPVDAVNFKALGNKAYEIIFTNQAKPDDSGVKGLISLMKLLKIGEDEPVAWNAELEINGVNLFDRDNEFIHFDLYLCDEQGDKIGDSIETAQADMTGLISFLAELDMDSWYLIEESFSFAEDDYRWDLYTKISPIITKPWQEGEPGVIDFTQITDPDPATGIVTKKDFVISTDKDNDLKMYECLDSYDNYSNGSMAKIVVLDDTVKYYQDAPTPIVPFWKSEMQKYSGSERFFEDLHKIWFESGEEEVRPDFVWNTNDFTDTPLAVSGNTLIFEKKFTLLEDLATNDEGEVADVPLYVTGDNAFIVFVNGDYVGSSTSLVSNQKLELTEENLETLIGDRTQPYVNASHIDTWAKTYVFDIKDNINAGAENTITIVCVNEANDPDQQYAEKPMDNPGGFIFGCEIVSQTEKFRFVNELPNSAVSGKVSITKLVDLGDGDPVQWTDIDYDDADDKDLIFFDIYDYEALDKDPACAALASTQIDMSGFINFGVYENEDGDIVDIGLVPGKEYLVRERFDDEDLAKKYVIPEDLVVTAYMSESDEYYGLNGDLEIINKFPKHHVLISNPDDVDLRSLNGDVVNVNNATTEWGSAKDFFDGNFNRYPQFGTMKDIELDVEGIGRFAEYVWNTDDFFDVQLAQNGDVVEYEKIFTDVGEIVGDDNDEVNLHIAADNAFLLFVNGEFVGQSDTVLTNYGLNVYDGNRIQEVIGDLSDNYIDCQNYDVLYTFNIKEFLKDNEDNTITIIVINESADEERLHEHGSPFGSTIGYNEYEDWEEFPQKNPAAAIFACEFWSK